MQQLAPLSLDVQAQRSDVAVWGGAVSFTDAGTPTGTCDGWNPSGTEGLVGDSIRSKGKNSLADGAAVCTEQRSVYCLEE